jgi:peptidoglycan/LPS O-acetylase OafA/YrhL
MQTTTARHDIYPLNWIRAIAALSVVMYHCRDIMLLPKYFGTDVAPLLAAGNSGVQLFFVLSGFVIYYVHHRDKEGDRRTLGDFAFKRFCRLYPPLWLVLIGLLPIFALGLFGGRVTSYELISAFLAAPLGTPEGEKLLAVEWTLRHEVLFYCIFAIFIWKRRLGLVLLIAWSATGAIFYDRIHTPAYLRIILNPNNALFLLGMMVAVLYVRGFSRYGRTMAAAGTFIFLLGWYNHIIHPEQFLTTTYLYGAGGALLIYGLVSHEKWNRSNIPIDLLGSASYSLYLIHYPTLSLLTKLSAAIELSPIGYLITPIGYFITMVAVCQALAIAFHLLVEKPVVRGFRKGLSHTFKRSAAKSGHA